MNQNVNKTPWNTFAAVATAFGADPLEAAAQASALSRALAALLDAQLAEEVASVLAA